MRAGGRLYLVGRGSSDLKLECAIWLADSEPIFDLRCAGCLRPWSGQGPCIRQRLSFVCRTVGLQLVVTAEEKAGFSLLAVRPAGQWCGSALTHEGQELLRRYSATLAEVGNLLVDVFDRNFADGGWQSIVDDSRSQVLAT
jgi:hypothetical protein